MPTEQGSAYSVKEYVTQLQQTLGQARQALESGNVQESSRICRSIIKSDPGFVPAYHLLANVERVAGNPQAEQQVILKILEINPNDAAMHNAYGDLLYKQGNVNGATQSFQKAISINDQLPGPLINLGNIYLNSGELDEAIGLYQRAIKHNPACATAYNNLGTALRSQKEFVDAENAYQKAVSLEPNYFDAYENLGNMLLDAERLEEAAIYLTHASKLRPKNAKIHDQLCGIYLTQFRLDDALVEIDQALSLDASKPILYVHKSLVLAKKDMHKEALQALEKALELDPDCFDAHIEIASQYKFDDDIPKSIEHLNKAVKLRPQGYKAYGMLGHMYHYVNNKEESDKYFKKAISLNPNDMELLRNFIMTRKNKSEDEYIKRALEMYKNDDVSDIERAHIAYGLGKAYEDMKKYDQAFQYFVEGGKRKRSTENYSLEETEILFSRLKQIFSKEFAASIKKREDFPQEIRPIFILGMPRSGTSLVEQMISNHPEVYGAGELTDLWMSALHCSNTGSDTDYLARLKKFREPLLQEIAEEYIRRIREISPDKKYLTDKMPHNFINVGLIRLSMPQAKIIHCKRNPMDSCFSMFKKFFIGNHPYTYDMVEMGKYYKKYLSLMEYWREVFPGEFYEIQYEELVENPETYAREMLEYCEIPWDDVCLSPEKNKRMVLTASSSQIREPIYKGAIQYWKRYEKQLEPMRQALEG